MANEIDYRHSATAETLYTVRKVAGSVWNGTALTTFVVADWSSYVTLLTETPAGSYSYYASMEGLPAGNWDIEIYKQLGGSPAITDTLLAEGDITWDGTAETITTPTGASSKSTYLALVNKVLKRISQPEISTVIGATGQAKIIKELINEAQNELWTEATNWYSLYTTRTFSTSNGTATYAVADNWGRTIDLLDTTNDRILVEDYMRSFDEVDPNADYTGNPTHFSIQGEYYILHPIPSATLTIRDRYWKSPSPLTLDSDVSNLPLFCENFLIHWAWMSILQYLQKYEAADRVAVKIYGNPAMRDKGILQKAKNANEKIIDKMFRFGDKIDNSLDYIEPPRFPSNYGRMY